MHIPQGKPVELRALEEIEMDPDFEAPDGTDFWAHIEADSGMYQYDAIGNLIRDQHEGVKISWTPYGKVREVRAKSDSLITTFRYDGAGNLIEKRVTRKDSIDIVSVTHYVRDASGNVMGVYTDSLMTEQYVYGTTRLGLYKGGRYRGQQSLGEKQYELSNHLGNVLAVITDNIGMSPADSVWASVVSTRDYYPFGLEMEGRMWSDTASMYRYGFNGKEKDGGKEWSNTAYDYGFRIYNPIIAKFLSVDPLTKSYTWYTPYQFAGNKPIAAIDLDGLEPKYVINSNGKLTKPMISLLSSAFSGHNSDWEARILETGQWLKDDGLRDTKNGVTLAYTRAIHKNTIYFNPKFDEVYLNGLSEKKVFSEWAELISHEEYHRMQFANWSTISTFVLGIHDIFASYENRISENTAFYHGDALGSGNSLMSKLMALSGEAIFSTISSTLPESEKVRQLSIIGLQFRLTQLDEEENNLRIKFEETGGDFSKEKKRFDKERSKISNRLTKLKND